MSHKLAADSAGGDRRRLSGEEEAILDLMKLGMVPRWLGQRAESILRVRMDWDEHTETVSLQIEVPKFWRGKMEEVVRWRDTYRARGVVSLFELPHGEGKKRTREE